MSMFSTFRKLRLSIDQGYHNAKKTIVTTLNSTVGYSSFIPDQLVIAPQDLRTSDPVMPEFFAQGQYTLGGHSVVVKKNDSPFAAITPNELWHRELHEFGWLRHYKNENLTSRDILAQVLVKEWMTLYKTITTDFKWDIETTSRRLISWLCHSDIILRNAEPEFYDDFMRCVGTHIRYLRRHAATTNDHLARLYAYIALINAALCRKNLPSDFKTIERRFNAELERQILPDGGHINRNPATILELLALLLPLKEAYAGRERETSQSLEKAIERLYPALHFFRMGDGNFARFNGAGLFERDLLITVLRYDNRETAPIFSAPQSGYERLEQDQAVLIIDTGAAPTGVLSETCHAGCLAFEFSSGTECIIVNAGTPYDPLQFKESLWRKSPYHSTAVLNEVSSCKFDVPRKDSDPFSGQIFSSKLRVTSERNDDELAKNVTASHLGYVREFGARHERRLRLEKKGKTLSGVEWFSGPDKGDLRYSTKDALKIHFHLHPDVSAAMGDGDGKCILTLRSGKQWQFTAEGFTILLEEAKYFASHSGPRNTLQIVVSAKISNTPEISWVLEEIQ